MVRAAEEHRMGLRVEGHRMARVVMHRADPMRAAPDRMDRRGMNLVSGDLVRMMVVLIMGRRRMGLMAVDLVRMTAALTVGRQPTGLMAADLVPTMAALTTRQRMGLIIVASARMMAV